MEDLPTKFFKFVLKIDYLRDFKYFQILLQKVNVAKIQFKGLEKKLRDIF
jgi:hypothetical protein